MAGSKPRQQANVTAVGRLGSDPAPVTKGGKLTKASLAVNQRVKKDGEWADGPTMWFDLNTAGPQLVGLSKGDLVQVTGRLAMREYEGKRFWTIWVEEATDLANVNEDSEFPAGA